MITGTTRAMLLACLAGTWLLAGCAQPDGPVLGEWQADTPGRNPDSTSGVDLVLYGGPGATSGRYNIKTTAQNPNQFSNHGTEEWGGNWTSTQGVVNGQPAKFITLHDHLPDQIGGYALASDGRLHALDPNGSYDQTPAGALYTLSPVRPRGAH
jgi:hypothetical protein